MMFARFPQVAKSNTGENVYQQVLFGFSALFERGSAVLAFQPSRATIRLPLTPLPTISPVLTDL